MSAADLDTYNGQLARLDLDHIRETANSIWSDMGGRPVAINYEPGNGTRYSLLFVPMVAVEQLHPEPVPAGLCDMMSGEIPPGWYVVAKVNCTDSDWVYPFQLTDGYVHHAGYVADKTGSGLADAVAITALFRAICGVRLKDSTP